MRICILNVNYQNSSSPFKDLDPVRDPSRFLSDHDCELVYIDKSTAEQQITELTGHGYDLFINLCDGAADEDRAGIEVVNGLDISTIPYTGADPQFYGITREVLKTACNALQIHTPECAFIKNEVEIKLQTEGLSFPLIVKHPNSYNSIGLTKESVVETDEQLLIQTGMMIHSFGGALIEEFIDGKEFTVLIAENSDDENDPIVYDPVEFSFPEGESFKHFEMKWVLYKEMGITPVAQNELRETLKEVSGKLFVGLNGTGYGRCDIRMDHKGKLFMIEMNSKPNVFYPRKEPGGADYILNNDPGGHKGFLEVVIKSAFARSKSR